MLNTEAQQADKSGYSANWEPVRRDALRDAFLRDLDALLLALNKMSIEVLMNDAKRTTVHMYDKLPLSLMYLRKHLHDPNFRAQAYYVLERIDLSRPSKMYLMKDFQKAHRNVMILLHDCLLGKFNPVPSACPHGDLILYAEQWLYDPRHPKYEEGQAIDVENSLLEDGKPWDDAVDNIFHAKVIEDYADVRTRLAAFGTAWELGDANGVLRDGTDGMGQGYTLRRVSERYRHLYTVVRNVPVTDEDVKTAAHLWGLSS